MLGVGRSAFAAEVKTSNVQRSTLNDKDVNVVVIAFAHVICFLAAPALTKRGILFLCAFRGDLIISIAHEPFELAGWADHKPRTPHVRRTRWRVPVFAF